MKRYVIVLTVAALCVLSAAGGYWLAAHRGTASPAGSTGSAPAPSGQAPKVLYWYDPMHPQQRFDKPGKSPFMDMDLVPKYAGEASDDASVAISPRLAQNLGIRTAEARPGSLAPALSATGNVEYNERSMVVVQPRANGFIEKLHVRAALDPVRAGAPLADVLFPEWVAAQEELLFVRTLPRAESDTLLGAARQRLALLGMSGEQIAAVERDARVHNRMTLRSPISGVVAELGAREGMTVASGATLFRIAGLGTVWVVAQVPEAQAAMLVPGAQAEVRVPAYPNERFTGRVSAILPELSATTRTVRARLEVQNPGGRLKPGMYASLSFAAPGKEALVVPADAVIRTGVRSVVILAEAEGKFRAVDVETGMEAGGSVEIRKGLNAGDKVVVSGQFLIDSEASLRGALGRLPAQEGAPGTAPALPGGFHRGTGKVTGVDNARGTVELEHGPIPSLKWPPMTMEFAAGKKSELERLKVGDTVQFELRGKPGPGGDYVIERIGPAETQGKP
jgi:Cu(I)/Ag(I) efflux system membrane fusion protein